MSELKEFALGMLFWAVFLTIALFVTSAFALDFSQKITDANDKVIVIDKEEMTLGRAVAQALFAVHPDDAKVSGEEKFSRGMLALKVRSGGEVAVTAEEITLMKKVVAQSYGSLMVAKVWPLLDAATAAPATGEKKEGE